LSKLAVFYDTVYLEHDTGNHPENKHRVEYTYDYLKSKQVFGDSAKPHPREASDDEILLVHNREYLDYLSSLPADRRAALDPDTVFGPGSLRAARYAAGAVVQAVDDIRQGLYDRAFCLVRPPGHHATPRRAMGFCILNNVAIGAAYVTRKCNLGRCAIIDLDVHHGNGTQEIFYEDASVLYCSTHRWPFYPGTGSSAEAGQGAGTGKTINVPLPPGSDEARYARALSDIVLPAVREHAPWIIFISAGFDAHRDDPLGGMNLDTESYGALTDKVTEAASEVCGGRIVSVLEGGYNLNALAGSVLAHLESLAG
jgi:acetoin utilization deacetylase AcuC-like enzyme